jgi:hypothetical protein
VHKPSPVWGSIFDQRKFQLHHFTIGFQKPKICADFWFLESNGKMVQLEFSLITLFPLFLLCVTVFHEKRERELKHYINNESQERQVHVDHAEDAH